MYINKLFPFLTDGDYIRVVTERKTLDEIFCPIKFKESTEQVNNAPSSKKYVFKAYHVLPCDVYVLNERESTIKRVIEGEFGGNIDLSVTEIDYLPIAKRIEVSDGKASVLINGAYMQEDIVTDLFINSAANGSKTLLEMLDGVSIEPTVGVDFRSWVDSEVAEPLRESADFLDGLLDATRRGKRLDAEIQDSGEDFIYQWLDSYFALPEGQDMKNGGREVVPLLIGPTGVFKSATVKELCKKYNYRLVDFRVSFTSRLDYSGLFQMGEVDGQKYSYACPMEELVTCSDGFREYCRKAYDRVSQILTDGYIEENKSSNGVSSDSTKSYLTDEQKETLQGLLESYKEYMKTPVLFCDEITRTKDAGVNGILVQLLNQKKFNNMTLKGCKFVAATNMNLKTGNTRHDDMMFQLDEMYDVNTDLDVAYSNRFMPLKVLPNDVAGRWYSWAEGYKEKNGKEIQNIHPVVLEFLKDPSSVVNGESLLYNETPVLDAIDNNLTENEQKSQTFPNYRTWEMLSDYMYTIDSDFEEAQKDDKDAVKVYRDTIINGLISSWAGSIFMKFLNNKGYRLYTEVNGEAADDVGDFLESTLGAGVPALMIGPSSLGKTSRVNAYMKRVEKKTGLKPILINVNLASMDTVDLMGMPTKVTLVDYVGGGKLSSKGLGAVGKELGDIVSSVAGNDEYGMVDTMTVRAPDKTMKDRFQKALKEGREVILFFDECNRVKNPTIMSAMFECISDSRFAGVSFKAQKDRVKIVAACNMAHSEMGSNLEWGEVGDYGDAGSLDPALAARFSVYWKKNYDEKDVKSWISFMEDQVKEGKIDGTILEYFKSLPVDKAIKIMASVEKRQLQDAESSTRALLQLSKDIKSMRGKPGPNGFQKSLYNGRVIFDDLLVNEFQQLNMNANDSSIDAGFLASQLHTFVEKILSQSSVWEPLMVGDKVTLNGREMTAQDLIDTLEALDKKLSEITLRALTPEDKNTIRIYVDTAISIVDACTRLDNKISDKRQNIFESYVGEEFARDFLPYFNSVFGTENDVEITIEMLEDETLITPFLSKKRAMMGSFTTDQMVNSMIELMKEFWKVHSSRLPSKNYSMLISGIGGIFPSSDSMAEMLSRSDKEVDGVYAAAEQEGDAWIMSILKSYPGTFMQQDIDDIRAKMQNNQTSATKRRTRIL